jgi:hypothetical protein
VLQFKAGWLCCQECTCHLDRLLVGFAAASGITVVSWVQRRPETDRGKGQSDAETETTHRENRLRKLREGVSCSHPMRVNPISSTAERPPRRRGFWAPRPSFLPYPAK